MKTLAGWNGESNEILYKILEDFGVKAKQVRLIKYQALSPDSSIWFFILDNSHYCLYAEDYIPSLNHVTETIERNRPEWQGVNTFELMEAIDVMKWEESSPVKSSDFYQKPQQADEIMKYATTSGTDFVFLARGRSSAA